MYEYAIELLKKQKEDIEIGIEYELIRYSQFGKRYWGNRIAELQQAIELLKKGEK